MKRDPRDIVREGYDALAPRYLEVRLGRSGADVQLLDEALADLPDGARVLDAGCGAGLPVAARLAPRFKLTGIDLSPTQVELARENVPGAEFRVGDLAALDAPAGAYDALVEQAGFGIDWVRVLDEEEEFGGGTHPFMRAHRL